MAKATLFDKVMNDRTLLLLAVHVALFLVAGAALAALNLWLGHPWLLWAFAGWGIAVAAHALAVTLERTRRRERIFIDKKARVWAVHCFIYLGVVILLFAVNYLRTPGRWWFYWVALGWGAGVAFQGWCTFWKHRRKRPENSHAHAAPVKAGARKRPAVLRKRQMTGSKR